MGIHNTSMMNDFPYLYRGIVLKNEDPKNLGRCKIYIPSIHGNSKISDIYLPWSRGVSSISVNSSRGNSCVPSVGDVVWVLFEGGNTDSPVYIGGTRGSSDQPVDLSKVVLYQEDEDIIFYDRNRNTFSINIGEASVELSRNDSTISLKAPKISIEGNLFINGVSYPTESE